MPSSNGPIAAAVAIALLLGLHHLRSVPSVSARPPAVGEGPSAAVYDHTQRLKEGCLPDSSRKFNAAATYVREFNTSRRDGQLQRLFDDLRDGLTLLRTCSTSTQCRITEARHLHLVRWPDLFSSFVQGLDQVNLELFATVPAECITGSRLGIYLEMLAIYMVPVLFLVTILLLVAFLEERRTTLARAAQALELGA